MKPRFVFVHGNGSTTWEVAWAVWLKKKLDGAGYTTHFETMPDPELARKDIWLPHLEEEVKVGAGDVLIGWSSGAVAAMRYAETHKLFGSILISPSYTDLDDATEKQSGYFDHSWDWKAIKSNQKKIALVYGDDDPYIPQSEFAYIAVHLSPDKLKIPGGGHFMHRQDMNELLRYIEKTYPL
ncbi:MAG: bbp9 [Candidatus Saccharibacteria bacterium]|nr:bbp9 [Candidatus Saccharibacteria bacterium]